MYRLQHEMARSIDERCLAAGISSPQDEDEIVAMGIECLYGGIGKLLPPVALMTCGLVCPHGEGGIQQKHPLLSPSREIACQRNWGAKVLLYLLEDILKGRREGHSVAYRKTESVCLPRDRGLVR